MSAEIETTISFPQVTTGEEPTVKIWTCEATMHIQMLKWKIEPEEARERNHVYCAWYTIPKSWVRIGPVRSHRKQVRTNGAEESQNVEGDAE